MRTKIAILSAAALTAGLLSSQAQVYSANVVGYTTSIGVSLPSGFALISNPLDLDLTGTNTTLISAIGTNVPSGTGIYAWDNVNNTFFSSAVYNSKKGWIGDTADANHATQPGLGFFIQSPSSNNITFVGQVLQNIGSRSHTVPAGFSIVSSIVPIAGGITSNTNINYAPVSGDNVYQWDVAGQTFFNSSVYNTKKGWIGNGEPNVQVGEAFFLNTGGNTWVQNFTAQ